MIRHLLSKLQQSCLVQGGIICLFWLASEFVVKSMKLPISGGVLGLGIVFILLITKLINVNSVKKGSELLLKDILLFFIPSVLALLEHHELMGILGIKILCAIVLSTIAVMLVTAVVVDYFYHWRTEHAAQHTQ